MKRNRPFASIRHYSSVSEESMKKILCIFLILAAVLLNANLAQTGVNLNGDLYGIAETKVKNPSQKFWMIEPLRIGKFFPCNR